MDVFTEDARSRWRHHAGKALFLQNRRVGLDEFRPRKQPWRKRNLWQQRHLCLLQFLPSGKPSAADHWAPMLSKVPVNYPHSTGVITKARSFVKRNPTQDNGILSKLLAELALCKTWGRHLWQLQVSSWMFGLHVEPAVLRSACNDQ